MGKQINESEWEQGTIDRAEGARRFWAEEPLPENASPALRQGFEMAKEMDASLPLEGHLDRQIASSEERIRRNARYLAQLNARG